MSQASGPNQHFLPRFLQRGFASRKKGKNPFVFFFQRNASAIERQISDIGADEYFYGHPSKSTVDEQLKIHEDRFGAMVARLREAKSTVAVFEPLVAELLAHMTVRTRNLRDGFRATSEQLMHALAGVTDTPVGETFLKRRIDAELGAELSKYLNQEPYRTLFARMNSAAREHIMAQIKSHVQKMNLGAAFGPGVRSLMGVLDFEKLTSSAHVKGLARLDGGVPQRVHALGSLTWELIVQPAGTFVLGDIAVMAQHEAGGLLQSPLKKNGTPQAILLPISDRHLLIGARDQSFSIDPDVVNQASAELSVDFFIASRDAEREQRYASRLGKRAALLTADEMDAILQSVVDDG